MTATLPPTWTTGLRRTVLSNGLTILAMRDAAAPAVSVVTHVRAGFFDEPDEWVGISHVLEHMFFKGTARRGPGDIARETKGLGGYLNAHTSYDHTAYFVVLPPEHLPAALDIQGDALRRSVIDADELARELKVIIEEAKRKLDSPAAVAQETLHRVLFDRHRIRRWRIGSAEQLARYTREDVVRYYHSRYVPSRTIVSIVGDVDPEAALDLAASQYADWDAPEVHVGTSPAEPDHDGIRVRTLRGDVAQSELVLGWRGVPALDDDAVPLDLAAAVLAAGRGSWLYQRLRERGVVTGVGAHHYAPTDVGVFAVGADLAADRIPDAIAEIGAAIGRLAQDGPEGDDLARARALLLQRWARRMESTEGRAMALAMAEALGDVQLVEREFARLGEATADEIRAAVGRVLSPASAGAVAYLPEGRGMDLDANALQQVLTDRPRARRGSRRVTWRPPELPVRRVPPGTRRAGVRHTALAGADLLVHRKAGVPLASVGLYFPRHAFDSPDDAGLGSLAMRSAVRGAGQFGSVELAFAFERLGGSVSPNLASDWFGFGTSVLAERAEEASLLLRLVAEEPRLDEALVARERALQLEEIAQATDDMFRYPFELAFGAAFRDTGYGLPQLGTATTLEQFDSARAREWLHRTMAGVRPVVLVVGDVDEERLSERLAARFADWPAAPTGAPAGPVPLAPRPEPRVVARDRAQTALAMLFPGPGRRDPRRHAANVWAAVASGLGGRLFEALRDRRSLAYTVLLTGWQRGRAGAIATYIATSPEREDEAREQMLAELGNFAAEPVLPNELDRAIRYLDGQVRIRRQSAAAIAAEVLESWLIGEGLDELVDPGAPFRSITAADIQEVAAAALASGHHAEGVVRGRQAS